MSLATLFGEPTEDAVRTALWTPSQRTRWGDLADSVLTQRRRLHDLVGQRVGLALSADRLGIATLAALETLACDTFLFSADLPEHERTEWGRQLNLAAILTGSDHVAGGVIETLPASSDSAGPAGAGSVTILTSGTTGQPKAVRHTWQGLARPVRRQISSEPPCWLLTFRPHLYAGLQVMLQALLNRGTLVAAPPRAEATEVMQLMADAHVQFASATPSYWRRLLMSSDRAIHEQVPLQQITLGGEVVDQAILDQLRETFPTARLIHIYATTELGRCFSVTDGQAGFPSSFLDHVSKDGVELQVRDDQLWVRSANAMVGYDTRLREPRRSVDADGWFATDDLVVRRGDRVFFDGRLSDMINVGGNKVYPITVERVIRQLVEVADVRVYGKSSSLAGQLVACQVIAGAGHADEAVRRRVREHCQQSLDRYECPRLIDIVSELPLTEAGKLVREGEKDSSPKF